ncbi:MAG: SpoIIE family protein phosphatase [Acidobacteriota bacterium]|nr:SpoIIE family protein phosphatase [Acidobacteriota bacterium]
MSKEHPIRKELGELYSEIDLNSLLNKIAGKIRKYLDCEQASIFLYDELKDELYFEIATGDKQEELKQIVFKKGEGAVGWVAEHQEPLIIHDCSSDQRFSAKTDLKTNFTTRSILGVPVRYDNNPLGVLEAINKIDGKFNHEDRETLETMARLVPIPLQNAVLFKKVKQETREKDRLLELAKSISYSSNQDEVFARLKEIICDIVTPLEINVLVYPQEIQSLSPQQLKPSRAKSHLYRLLTNTRDEADAPLESIDDTIIDDSTAVFPLKSQGRRLGTLELKLEKKIPEAAAALIRGLAAFAAILVEKLEMQARMIEQKKLEKELEIAREIQQYFLPGECRGLKGLDVASVNIPSSQLGGDYYDIIPFNDNETVFTINDTSGHGIPASLLMSTFRANFVYHIKKDKDMVEVISNLNNLIVETTEPNHYVTSFTCRLDRENMKLSYVNAGHNAPFILREEKVIKLEKGSLSVGLFPDVIYEAVEIDVRPDDLLVLYTDGIVEAENPAGLQYSLERLLDFLTTHREKGAKKIKEMLIEELKGFIGKNHFEDDVTFILIKIIG